MMNLLRFNKYLAVFCVWMVLSVITAYGQGTSAFTDADLTANNLPDIYIQPVSSFDQQLNVESRHIHMTLNLENSARYSFYALGKNTWSVFLNGKLTARSNTGQPLQEYQVRMAIDPEKPEQIYTIDYSPLEVNNMAYFDFVIYDYWINTDEFGAAITADADEALVRDLVLLKVQLEDHVGYHTLDQSGNEILIDNLSVTGKENLNAEIVVAEFNWSLASGSGNRRFEKYDLEVLKVEPDVNSEVIIDWEIASRVEIDNGLTWYRMTLSEGTGYYFWRVRPVGTFYEGGRADHRNYGEWSVSPPNGPFSNKTDLYQFPAGSEPVPLNTNSLSLTPLFGKNYFHYTQFNEQTNWIYSKVLTEGSRQSETMTFANGLNQVQQVQTKLFSEGNEGQVIGTHTARDFSGRPALQTLPAPVNDKFLGYRDKFFKKADGNPVTAADFDDGGSDKTLYPRGIDLGLSMLKGSVAHYYSEVNSAGQYKYGNLVPNADSLPYTRTMFYNDATGRVFKQGGAGKVMRLQKDDDGHNVTTRYAGVSQDELDRLFGIEAPNDTDVYKVITVDPNKVTSVSYIAKAGQVLATALVEGGPVNNLDEVDGLSGPNGTPPVFSVTDVFAAGKPVDGANYSSVHQTIDVEKTKDVTLNYEITLNSFQDVCGGICYECDYRVEIRVTNPMDQADVTKNGMLAFSITPGECTNPARVITLADIGTSGVTLLEETGVFSGGNHITLTLEKGTYLIEKRVYGYNEDQNGVRYIDALKKNLIADRENNWSESNNPCGCPLDIREGYNCDESLDCSDHQQFAQDLWNAFVVTEINNSTYTNALLSDPISKTYTVTRLAGDIGRLTAAPYNYSCEKIEDCFNIFGKALTSNINYVLNKPEGNSKTPSPEADLTFDLLKDVFISCLDYNYEEYESAIDPQDCATYEDVIEYVEGGTEPTEMVIRTWYVESGGIYPQTPGVNDVGDDIKDIEILAPGDNYYGPETGTERVEKIKFLTQNTRCVELYRWPNQATLPQDFSTEAEERAYLAQKVCECVGQPLDQSASVSKTEEENLADVIGACDNACESRRLAFEAEIAAYELIHDPEGSTSCGGYFRSTDDYYSCTFGCNRNDLVDLLIAQCKLQCQMPDAIDPDLSQLSDPDYVDEIRKQQHEYEQAFQWNADVAPYLPQYRSFGDPFELRPDMIYSADSALTFLLNEIRRIETTLGLPMTATDIAAADYPVSLQTSAFDEANCSSCRFQQGVREFKYNTNPLNSAEEFNYYHVAQVVTVIWEPSDASHQFPRLKELSVAFYCEGGTTPYAKWSFAPAAPCDFYERYQLYEYLAEQDLVKFSFDVSSGLHAVMQPNACTGNLELTNISKSPYLAKASFVINGDGGNVDNEIFVQVGEPGEMVYIHDQPVVWNNTTSATASNLVAAINKTVTVPNYFAEIDPANASRVIIHASAITDISPAGYDVTSEGGVTITPDGTGEMELLVSSFFAAGSGCPVLTDQADKVCPYGYKEIILTDELIGSDAIGYKEQVVLPSAKRYEDTEFGRTLMMNDLFDFWKGSLERMVRERQDEATLVFPTPSQIGNGFFYTLHKSQEVQPFFFDDKRFDAVTTLFWDDDPDAPVRYMEVVIHRYNPCTGHIEGNAIFAAGIGNSCPENDVNGQLSNCSGFAGQSFPMLTDIDNLPIGFIDKVFSLEYSMTNLAGVDNGDGQAGTWVDDLHIQMRVDPQVYVRNIRNVHGVVHFYNPVDQVDDFRRHAPDVITAMRQESQLCIITEPSTECGICLRWRKPRQVPIEQPVIPTCEQLEAEYHDTQVREQFDNCLADKLEILDENYRASCLGNVHDEFKLTYPLSYYHYTLYYYDRANNLLTTIPPKEVKPLDDLTAVRDFRDARDYDLYCLQDHDDDNQTHRQFEDCPSTGSSLTGCDCDFEDLTALKLLPDHRLQTDYTYNSIKQLVKQHTPDGDTSKFWYNAAGQLVLSQDAQQKIDDVYSFTRYDALGRIVEVGELSGFTPTFREVKANALTDAPGLIIEELWVNRHFPYSSNPGDVTDPNNTLPGYVQSGIAVDEAVYTVYTKPYDHIHCNGLKQQHLRNRVSKTQTDDGFVCFYSYDPHGNVEWLVSELPEIGRKSVRYEYDLVSGNVKRVFYNEETPEQFIHRYEYDSDNRITQVFTSTDGIYWEKEAGYDYYLHGPLARTEIGEDNLQGMDYVYTIEGYLKAINQPELLASRDPGADGTNVSEATGFIEDEFGMELGYYNGDYTRSNTYIGQNNPTLDPFAFASGAPDELFNGNIAYWMFNTRSGGSNPGNTMLVASNPLDGIKMNTYRYDKLNRIKKANFRFYNTNPANTGWDNVSDRMYDEEFSYDANGNITNLKRYGYVKGSNSYGDAGESYLYDNMHYGYNTVSGRLINNRLTHVDDYELNNSTTTASYGTDIGDQAEGNYEYDAEGNLIKDVAENIEKISWNVINKVEWVKKKDDDGKFFYIVFEYDAMGNRSMKFATKHLPPTDFVSGGGTIADDDPSQVPVEETTYYVRDASGNVMAIYDKRYNSDRTEFRLIEQPIYGSSRLGQHRPNTLVAVYDGQPHETVGKGFIQSSTATEMNKWLVPTTSGLRKVDFTFSQGATVTILPSGSPGASNYKNNAAVELDDKDNIIFGAATNKTGSQIWEIYGRDLQAMSNPNNLTLNAEWRANATPVIIEKPNTPDHYYFIYQQQGGFTEAQYVEVDMTANSGNGAIISTAVNSIAPGYMLGSKVVDITYEDGNSRLFVYKKSDDGLQILLYSIDVTVNGFATPIHIASVPNNFGNNISPSNEMAISPDGKSFAMTHYQGETPQNTTDPGFFDVVVWDFTADCGLLNNPRMFKAGDGQTIHVEFSPGGHNLYYTVNNSSSDGEVGRINLESEEVQPLLTTGTFNVDIQRAVGCMLIIDPNFAGQSLTALTSPDADDPQEVTTGSESISVGVDLTDGLPQQTHFAAGVHLGKIQGISYNAYNHWVAAAKPDVSGNPAKSGIIDVDFTQLPPTASNVLPAAVSTFKNVAVAENEHGELQFKFVTTEQFPDAGLVISSDGEHFLKNGLLFPDATGNGYVTLKSDPNTPAIVAEAPQIDANRYYYIITGHQGKLYAHKVNMNYFEKGVSGIVEEANIELTAPGFSEQYDLTHNQYALTVHNDLTNPNKNWLFVAINTGEKIHLFRHDISATGIGQGQFEYGLRDEYCRTLGGNTTCTEMTGVAAQVYLAQMQISPDGKELGLLVARGNGDIDPTADPALTYTLERFEIGFSGFGVLNHTETVILASEDRAPKKQGGKLKKLLKKKISSFDYSPEGRYIYYVEKITPQSSGGGFLNSVWNSIFGKNARMMRVELATGNIEEVRKFNISGHESEIRRGVDDKLYINKLPSQILNFLTPQYISELKYYYDLDDATASAVGVSEGTLNLGFSNNNWGLPLQPYRRYLKAEEAAHCGEYASRKKGDRVYQLTDHLGSVRVVISDIREATISTTLPTTIEAFYPEVVNWADYGAYGNVLPGRFVALEEYRFGAQTQERVDELKGPGNHYTARFWEYDPRVVQRWNNDPKFRKYPGWSPYAINFCNPVWYRDINGDEGGNEDPTKIDWKKLEEDVLNPDNNETLKKLIELRRKGEKAYGQLQSFQKFAKAVDALTSISASNSAEEKVQKITTFYNLVAGYLPKGIRKASYIGEALKMVEQGVAIYAEGLRARDEEMASYGQTTVTHPGAWPGGWAVYKYLKTIKDAPLQTLQDQQAPEEIVDFYKSHKVAFDNATGLPLNIQKRSFLGLDYLAPDVNNDVWLLPLYIHQNFETIQTLLYGNLTVE